MGVKIHAIGRETYTTLTSACGAIVAFNAPSARVMSKLMPVNEFVRTAARYRCMNCYRNRKIVDAWMTHVTGVPAIYFTTESS